MKEKDKDWVKAWVMQYVDVKTNKILDLSLFDCPHCQHKTVVRKIENTTYSFSWGGDDLSSKDSVLTQCLVCGKSFELSMKEITE